MRDKFNFFFVRWMIALMVLPGLVHAQAVPASSFQKAISQLISNKLAKRGFAANDPRFAATFQNVGAGIGSSAAAAAVVTAAGVTAPAWVTAAATAALGAIFYYGINLAVDGVKWLVNGDGSVTYTKPGDVPVLPTGKCYRDTRYGGCAPSIADVLTNGNPMGNYANICPGGARIVGSAIPGWWELQLLTASGSLCMSSSVLIALVDGTPSPLVNADAPYIGMQPPVTATPSAAVSAISDSDKAKPVNPEIVAKIADNAWKYAASQPGYSGVPYDNADPITVTDAQAVYQANPAGWPTVSDLVSPQVAPSGQPATQPWSIPAPNTGSDPSTDPGTDPDANPVDLKKVEVTNWGNFAAPTLESTPTIQSIIDPLLNMWPAWSSFAFPQHEASCPRPSFKLPGGVINGHTVDFTQMCDFIEQNNVRQAMQAAFAVAWAILIVFVVMSA